MLTEKEFITVMACNVIIAIAVIVWAIKYLKENDE